MEKYAETQKNIVNAKLSPFLFYVFILLSVFTNAAFAFEWAYEYVDQDAYVAQQFPTYNFNGADELRVGQDNAGDNRTYLKFNVKDISLPANSVKGGWAVSSS